MGTMFLLTIFATVNSMKIIKCRKIHNGHNVFTHYLCNSKLDEDY